MRGEVGSVAAARNGHRRHPKKGFADFAGRKTETLGSVPLLRQISGAETHPPVTRRRRPSPDGARRSFVRCRSLHDALARRGTANPMLT
jgi:hypothetical protein